MYNSLIMQPIFKQYNQGQAELFPQRLEDYIGENDPVRLVNQLVSELGLNSVIQSYKRRWDQQFLSQNDDQGIILCLHAQHLFLP